MVPSSVAARSNGISITSASVKKGHPTVAKYTWKYHDSSPEYFTVGIIEVSSKEWTPLDWDIETFGYGSHGTGKSTVSIEVLRKKPGKYVLVLVDIYDNNIEYAKSKPFVVKKSHF